VAAGDNHHRIIEFAGFAQRGQHPIDLGINIACRLAVAADKALLLRVVEGGAVERDPREPAILILRVTVQPADPLIGRLLVALVFALGSEKSESSAWRYSGLLNPSEENRPSW
jgi:hypothetical protein